MKKQKWICLLLIVFSLFSSIRVYADTNAVTAKIPVRCSSEGSDATFVFQLIADTNEYQQIASDTLRISDGKEDVFLISYVCPGTYSYIVKQVFGSDANVTYDDTVYRVNVYVTEDDQGVMYAETIVYTDASSEKRDACSFVNTVVSKPLPENTSSDGSDRYIESIQTGDVLPTFAWVGVIGSVCILFVIAIIKKRKEKKYEET